MRNNSSELFYTAINALIFCFFVTAAVGMFGLLSKLMTTKTEMTRDRTTLTVADYDVSESYIDVYMGRKEYSLAQGDALPTPSSLSGGKTFEIKDNSEYVTAASVFTELCNLPDTVETVYVNGAANSADTIREMVKNGKTSAIYNIVGGTNKNRLYLRKYENDCTIVRYVLQNAE